MIERLLWVGLGGLIITFASLVYRYIRHEREHLEASRAGGEAFAELEEIADSNTFEERCTIGIGILLTIIGVFSIRRVLEDPNGWNWTIVTDAIDAWAVLPELGVYVAVLVYGLIGVEIFVCAKVRRRFIMWQRLKRSYVAAHNEVEK